MNITVYLGANFGNKPIFKDKVIELGKYIGSNGYTLIYGGSKAGLMGALAISCMESGGKVIGIEPRSFVEKELQLDGLNELIVTENMRERKTKLIEYGDAFIAFPGGTGTLEEVSEVMSMASLNKLNRPCIIYNIDGYYDSFKLLLDRMVEDGLSTKERLCGISFCSSLSEIDTIIKSFVKEKENR